MNARPAWLPPNPAHATGGAFYSTPGIRQSGSAQPDPLWHMPREKPRTPLPAYIADDYADVADIEEADLWTPPPPKPPTVRERIQALLPWGYELELSGYDDGYSAIYVTLRMDGETIIDDEEWC